MDRIPLDDLFDRRLELPDFDARKRFDRLVGIEEAKIAIDQSAGYSGQPRRT